jgi:hypothetical protein
MPRGGARPGAGRRKTALSRTIKPLTRKTAEEILAQRDEQGEWNQLLDATTVVSVRVVGGEDGEREQLTLPDHRVRLDALKYLTDRRDGKPRQNIDLKDEREATRVLLHAPDRQPATSTIQ